MKLINTHNGYDFYTNYDDSGQGFYNIVKQGEKNPESGYFKPDYILLVKGFNPEDVKYFNKVKTLDEIFPKGSITEVYGIKEQLLRFLLNNNIPPTDNIINQIELIVNLAVRNSKQR
jgi:hypothetical protein